jgi:hypothetical protein
MYYCAHNHDDYNHDDYNVRRMPSSNLLTAYCINNDHANYNHDNICSMLSLPRVQHVAHCGINQSATVDWTRT